MSMELDAGNTSMSSPSRAEKKRKYTDRQASSPSKRRKHHGGPSVEPTEDAQSSLKDRKKREKEHKHKDVEDIDMIEHSQGPAQAEMAIDATPQEPAEIQSNTKKKRKKQRALEGTASLRTEEPSSQPPANEVQSNAPDATPPATDTEMGLAISSSQNALSDDPTTSPFSLITLALYVHLSPIAISPTTALDSLVAEHLSPLLLSYYPPLKGVILAFSDPSVSSTQPSSPSMDSTKSTKPALANTLDESGASYLWLTATFLIFQPRKGQPLSGWQNVCSENFFSLVVLNYFQAVVAGPRIPPTWKWTLPGGESKARKKKRQTKRLKSSDDEGKQEDAQVVEGADYDADTETAVGFYLDTTNDSHITEHMSLPWEFTITDIDVTQGAVLSQASLHIDGTLLSPEAEQTLLKEEKIRFERLRGRSQAHTDVPAMMSGGLGPGRENSLPTPAQTPQGISSTEWRISNK